MRTSPDFASNPIGVEVDPLKLIAAREAIRDVLKRSRARDFLPEQPGDLRLPG